MKHNVDALAKDDLFAAAVIELVDPLQAFLVVVSFM
jgi:hypothetical protein